MFAPSTTMSVKAIETDNLITSRAYSIATTTTTTTITTTTITSSTASEPLPPLSLSPSPLPLPSSSPSPSSQPQSQHQSSQSQSQSLPPPPASRESAESVYIAPKHKALLTTQAPQRMSISTSLKRRFPFCSSPLSSSHTPECTSSSAAHEEASSLPQGLLFVDSENVDMSGCQPVANPFHSLPHTKPAIPGMTGGSSISSSNTGGLMSFSNSNNISSNNHNLNHNLSQHQLNTNTNTNTTNNLHNSHSLHSISTSASSSNNSSPTTTISTAESTSTESDTLASSDPNSPTTSMLPLSDFAFRNMGRGSPDELTAVAPKGPAGSCPQSISPSKKPRNTKNLSLNVPPPVGIPRAQPTGIDPSMQGISPRSMSAPSSPAFILPPPPPAPKRKPSNLGLTIKLPSTLGQGTGMKAVGGGGLRHHQSSPSLFSPGPGSMRGGMRLPPPSLNLQNGGNGGQSRSMHPPRQCSYDAPSSITPSASPPRTPPAPLHEMDEEDDEPRSGEAKSPAYPAGPVCIFDPHVFLFAEPDADLACKFDVVINVAREVLNPLTERDRKNRERRASRPLSMIPDTACTDASFSTAMEEAMFSPAPVAEKRPEYIHMPWDHNTPIVDELPPLVKLIRDRVAAGKKVLVHCQCGVSRSASLLIAYALYMKPHQTVQEAYDSVKNRSRWIGPNMSLIYQLSEWKTRLGKEDMGQPGYRPGMGNGEHVKTNNFGRKTRGAGGAGAGGGLLAGQDGVDDMPEPLTAPLPHRPPPESPLKVPSGGMGGGGGGGGAGGLSANGKHIPQMVRTRSDNGGMIPGISPGPSSAPPGMMTIPYKNLQMMGGDDDDDRVDDDEVMKDAPSPVPLKKVEVEVKERDVEMGGVRTVPRDLSGSVQYRDQATNTTPTISAAAAVPGAVVFSAPPGRGKKANAGLSLGLGLGSSTTTATSTTAPSIPPSIPPPSSSSTSSSQYPPAPTHPPPPPPTSSSSHSQSTQQTQPTHLPAPRPIKPSPSTERLRRIGPIRPQDVLPPTSILFTQHPNSSSAAMPPPPPPPPAPTKNNNIGAGGGGDDYDDEDENPLSPSNATHPSSQPATAAFMSPRNSGYFGFGTGGRGVMGGIGGVMGVGVGGGGNGGAGVGGKQGKAGGVGAGGVGGMGGGMGGVGGIQGVEIEIDPRSPPSRTAEKPVIRSIFDVL